MSHVRHIRAQRLPSMLKGCSSNHRRRRSLELEALESRQLLTTLPIDSEFSDQWNLHNVGQKGGKVDADIDAPRAWDATTGNDRAVVAVIDSGVDYTHQDLYLNIWINQGEIPTDIRNALIDLGYHGVITFRDLQGDDVIAAGIVQDKNGNDYIDAGDLLHPTEAGGWENLIDNDGNGKIDDLVGWNFKDDNNDPISISGSEGGHHGTNVAGILGAMTDNAVDSGGAFFSEVDQHAGADPCNFGGVSPNGNVAGINWRLRIMPLRIFTPYKPTAQEGLAGAEQAIDALNYAITNGAHVSNHSYTVPESILEGTSLKDDWEEVIGWAASADHVVVAGAGNDGADVDLSPRYPASFDKSNVLTVTASDRNDDLPVRPVPRSSLPEPAVRRRPRMGVPSGLTTNPGASCFFPAYGDDHVDLAAPGEHKGIITLSGDDTLNSSFGRTSAAAPHVTGAVSLIQDWHPGWNYQQVIEQVLWSVDVLPSLENLVATSGRLNAGTAIQPQLQILFSTNEPGSAFGSDLWHVLWDNTDIVQLSIYEHPVTGEELYRYGVYLDGSDVGLSSVGEDIDAVTVLDDNSILLSFKGLADLPGLGIVHDEDVVQFVPTSLGNDTAGTWHHYFDGSDVGITFGPGQDVDSVHALADGDLLISTVGAVNLPVPDGARILTMQDEDLWRFHPTSTGDTTAGSLSLYFDGSDVGMSDDNEDVDGAFVDETLEKVFLSTTGALVPNFDGPGTAIAIAQDEDIVEFDATTLGANTSGDFQQLLDGSNYELIGLDIDAFHIEFIAEPPPFDPPVTSAAAAGMARSGEVASIQSVPQPFRSTSFLRHADESNEPDDEDTLVGISFLGDKTLPMRISHEPVLDAVVRARAAARLADTSRSVSLDSLDTYFVELRTDDWLQVDLQ